MTKLSATILVISLVIALGVSGMANADDLTPAKKADVRTLMELAGTNNMPVQVANMAAMQIVQQVQASRGDMTPQAAKGVQEELQTLFKQNAAVLLDKVEPVYASNFSHNEIKELIKFFKSPIGKKFSSTVPLVARESQQVGQEWAQSQKAAIEARVRTRLKKDGIDLDQPPAAKAAPATPAPPTSSPAPAKPSPAPAPSEKK